MTPLLLLALAAAPLPLRDGPPAPRLVHRVLEEKTSKPCTLEHRTFDDARVKDQWLARCGAQKGVWLAFDPARDVAGVGLFAQHWTDTTLAFGTQQAAAFSRATPEPWVPPGLLKDLDAQRGPPPVPGFVRLGVDPRDGAVVGHSHERGFLRLTKAGPRPLFDGKVEAEWNTPMRAAFFDEDGPAGAPWLAYAPDPWRRVELRLRAPSGEERLLYQQPSRTTGGSYRVAQVDAVRPRGAQLATLGLQADGAYLLFTPKDASATAEYTVRRFEASAALDVPPPPEGQTNQPRAEGPACSDAQLRREDEALFDPKLVTWKGRVFLIALSETMRTAWRFGVVPRVGKTPAEDRLACEWIVDARRSEVALVLGEVMKDGSLRERVRTDIDIITGGSFHGSTNAVSLVGDEVAVVSSTYADITLTRFDLKALPAR